MNIRRPGSSSACICAIVLSLILGGCLHIEKTTSNPIHGVLLGTDGAPIAGAQIWAYVEENGFFYKPENIAFGPALTNADGTFVIPMKAASMLETDTVFDGTTTPGLIIIHRDRGAFGAFAAKEGKDMGFMKLVWPAPISARANREHEFSMIDQLPRAARKIAKEYLSGR